MTDDPLSLGLKELCTRPDVARVVAVDRAGRVVAWNGFRDRATLTRLGALTAGVHAIAARLSEVAGDPGRSRIRLHTEEGIVILFPLAFPSTRILLMVLGPGHDELTEGTQLFLDDLALPDHAPLEVFDPEEFEASLALPDDPRPTSDPDPRET